MFQLSDSQFGLYIDGRVVFFAEVAKRQTGWETKHDKWKLKEHIFK